MAAFGTFTADPPPRRLDYRFPAGVTYWTNPFVIEGQTGMTIAGTRSNGVPSRMVYRGPPAKGVIQFIGCTRCKLIDLEIVDESGCDATVLQTNDPNPNLNGFSTSNEIRNVRVLHGSKGSRRAFSVDSTAAGGADANNDHHQFIDCYAQSYVEAGFYVSGSQAHDLYFLRCQAHDVGGRKPVGLHAAGTVFFEWHRGAMNSNGIDFKFGTPEVQGIVSGHNSENGQRFLVAELSGQAFVRVTDVRWDGKPVSGSPVVSAKGPGPWSIGNSYFAGINGVCPLLRFSGTSPGSLDVSGVMIRQHGGTAPVVAVMSCPTTWDIRQHGLIHQLIESSGNRVTKPIKINQ